jgi:hypothetical protein
MNTNAYLQGNRSLFIRSTVVIIANAMSATASA